MKLIDYIKDYVHDYLSWMMSHTLGVIGDTAEWIVKLWKWIFPPPPGR